MGARVKPAAFGLLALAMGSSGCATAGPAGAPGDVYPFPAHGAIRRETTAPWQWLRDDPSLPPGCGVQDNRWNERHAARGPSAQRGFVEDLEGAPALGWQWRWPQGAAVVTYPEVHCGSNPWDVGQAGLAAGGGFPFQPGRATVVVDYRVRRRSAGVDNLAFSLWAVADPGAPRDTITNEIMVWIANDGMTPAGERIGTVASGATRFDVWVHPDHGDASGGSWARWTYAAFVAREPVLAGPLDLTPLLDFLRATAAPRSGRPVLADGAWIGDLMLGSEVVGGAGVVEVGGFSYHIGAR